MRCRLRGNRILTVNCQKASELSVELIGVVGAGKMGNGIPQACAVVGIPVVMTDFAQAAVDRGLKTIDGSLERLVQKKDKLTAAGCPAALPAFHIGAFPERRRQVAAISSGAVDPEEPVKLPSLVVLVLISGCAASPGHQHGGADHCAEYRATMAGKSLDEQRKAAEEHIVKMHGSADAAHIERHMRMMEQRCGKAAG